MTELAAITDHIVLYDDCGWPIKVEKMELHSSHDIQGHNSVHHKETLLQEGGMHPSLYPILLLLSKLRSSALAINVEDQAVGNNVADVTLFIPLVMQCRCEKVYKAREMASKALAALVPLQLVPSTACKILNSLHEKIDLNQLRNLSSNELHGYLFLVLFIIRNLTRQMGGIGDNR